MHTLDTFYKSTQWQKFRSVLINDRLTADGEIICEHCGKPIYKKYDIIAHHKKKLTDDNVNNAELSLNPDNIELIHFKCHNAIHQRFDGFKQRVYLVYGSPCSGKTTFVYDNAYDDDLILDVDKIWECVCKNNRYNKSSRLKANVFGIRDTILDQIRTRTGMWRNAYVIGGYPLRTDRDPGRLCL